MIPGCILHHDCHNSGKSNSTIVRPTIRAYRANHPLTHEWCSCISFSYSHSLHLCFTHVISVARLVFVHCLSGIDLKKKAKISTSVTFLDRFTLHQYQNTSKDPLTTISAFYRTSIKNILCICFFSSFLISLSSLVLRFTPIISLLSSHCFDTCFFIFYTTLIPPLSHPLLLLPQRQFDSHFPRYL